MFQKNISLFIEDQFPDNFKNDGELLVKFMEYYYQWMEETGNVTFETRRLLDYNDPDSVPEDFFKFLRDEFMKNIPKNLLVNEKTLLKNILDFYKTRGTESSYRLLFRILFNVEINFYYPGDDILRASDGRWTIERYIKIINMDESIDILLLGEIEGSVSKARARIERIELFSDAGVIENRLFLAAIFGNFVSGEDLVVRDTSAVLCQTVSALVTEPGKYIGTYGQLSSNKKLQDNFYYQEYSYEIQSPMDILKYEKIVQDLVHPAGTKLFGKVLTEFDLGNLTQYVDVQFGQIWVEVDFGSILIDNSNLEILEDAMIDLSFIVDFERITTIGTGLLSINDGQIIDFGNDFSIFDFSSVPISLIGKRNLIIGTGTQFSTEINQPNGPIVGEVSTVIKINDLINGPSNVEYNPDKTYGNRFMTFTEDYYFPTLNDQGYTIQRAISANNVVYDESIANTSLGIGTVTVANTAVIGTGTNFSTDFTSGDIIEVFDNVNGNTFAFVISVNSNTSLTLNENYKWGIANTSSYKVYAY